MAEREQASLGLASNEDMLRELICRFKLDSLGGDVGVLPRVERALTLAEMLGSMDTVEREYRTVDAS